MLAGLLSEVAGVRWTITVFAAVAFVAGCAYLVFTRNVITSVAAETQTIAE